VGVRKALEVVGGHASVEDVGKARVVCRGHQHRDIRISEPGARVIRGRWPAQYATRLFEGRPVWSDRGVSKLGHHKPWLMMLEPVVERAYGISLPGRLQTHYPFLGSNDKIFFLVDHDQRPL